MSSAATEAPVPSPRPFWIPEGLKFGSLSPGLQCAITDIINPLYQEMVLNAESGFQRSIGFSYVHAAWLELIEAVELGLNLETALPSGQGLGDHQERIGRYLRIVAAKDKLAKFHIELQKTQIRLAEMDPLRNIPR